MEMVQTYQGYFQNGRFVSPDVMKIPENVEVRVTVTGRELPLTKTRAQRQGEAIRRFMSAIDATDNQFTEADFADLDNRANFSREVEL